MAQAATLQTFTGLKATGRRAPRGIAASAPRTVARAGRSQATIEAR